MDALERELIKEEIRQEIQKEEEYLKEEVEKLYEDPAMLYEIAHYEWREKVEALVIKMKRFREAGTITQDEYEQIYWFAYRQEP